MRRRILISGAAGFLGSHLTKQLLSEGHEVIGLDNLCTGLLENIRDAADHPLFTFIHIDVSCRSVVDKLRGLAPTEIYHLASPASPKLYQQLPFETIAVNTIGTHNMLELARLCNAKLVFASTSEAYGDPEVHPQPESYRGNVNTWGPRACYDESKRMGEVYCYEYFHRHHVQVKVARIFNTYSAGLRSDDGRIISNFVTQALRGQDITVFGDGSQTRSFCYVDDTIAGLRLMMEHDSAIGEIINIGNPKEYSVLEVAHIVKRLTGTNSPIVRLPLPADDPRLRRPVIDKAQKLLGWSPKISLEEGLGKMIQVYQEKLLNRGEGSI